MNEEQDPPERPDRYDFEYDVHGVPSTSPRLPAAPGRNGIIEWIEPGDNREEVAGPIGPITASNRGVETCSPSPLSWSGSRPRRWPHSFTRRRGPSRPSN